jgi:hypothetical protein
MVMTEDARTHTAGRAPERKLLVWHVVVGAAVILIAIGVVAWLVLRNGNSSSSTSPIPKGGKAVPISVQGLRTIASLGIPIYWVGEKPGLTYELTKTNDNRVFIRYLPAGVPIGSEKPYLTIGTYPMANAFAVTTKAAAKSSSVPIPVGKDTVEFYNRSSPTSVFIAYRGSDYQIEVYDPSPDRARALVGLGQVVPVK